MEQLLYMFTSHKRKYVRSYVFSNPIAPSSARSKSDGISTACTDTSNVTNIVSDICDISKGINSKATGIFKSLRFLELPLASAALSIVADGCKIWTSDQAKEAKNLVSTGCDLWTNIGAFPNFLRRAPAGELIRCSRHRWLPDCGLGRVGRCHHFFNGSYYPSPFHDRHFAYDRLKRRNRYGGRLLELVFILHCHLRCDDTLRFAVRMGRYPPDGAAHVTGFDEMNRVAVLLSPLLASYCLFALFLFFSHFPLSSL